MNKLSGYLLTASGFVVFVAALVLSVAQEAHAPGAAPVLVTNTTAQPVPTAAQGTTNVGGTVGISSSANTVQLLRDPENPARQPFFGLGLCNSSDPDISCTSVVYHVPDGKRAVVEHFSGRANLAASGRVVIPSLIICFGANVGCVIFHAPLTASTAAFANFNSTSWSQSVRLYAEPGTDITGNAIRSGSGDASYSFEVSGYLVDVPLTP